MGSIPTARSKYSPDMVAIEYRSRPTEISVYLHGGFAGRYHTRARVSGNSIFITAERRIELTHIALEDGRPAVPIAPVVNLEAGDILEVKLHKSLLTLQPEYQFVHFSP